MICPNFCVFTQKVQQTQRLNHNTQRGAYHLHITATLNSLLQFKQKTFEGNRPTI